MSLSVSGLRDLSRAMKGQDKDVAEALMELAEIRDGSLAAERHRLAVRLYAAGVYMRDCQRAYFTTRSRDALVRSKSAEADFDDILRETKNLGAPVQTQLDLGGGK